MIDYGQAASNQMQMEFEGMTSQGAERMREAREWIGCHFNEWCDYKRFARADMESSPDGKASPNYVLQTMRHRCKVSVKNHLAPYLARIAMEQVPDLAFRIARCEGDGYAQVAL